MKTRADLNARAVIRGLLDSQRLGVLATRERSTPYQSLVAFAVSRDLKDIYFATESETRKHANLIRFPRASMLFDNRRNAAADFRRGIAVTAMGKARLVEAGSKEGILRLYLRKHPSLEDFVRSPSCRIFQIHVETYIIVTNFQRIIAYNPNP